jgi:PAS domain S-box-containing protein
VAASLVFAAIFAAGTWLVRGHPFAQSVYGNAGLLLSAAAVCVVVLVRRRVWRGSERLFWDIFGLGMALWVVGHVGWAVSDLFGRSSWIQWHTLFTLIGGTGPIVALVARPHRRLPARHTTPSAIDAACFTLLAAFIYAYFVLVPSLVPADRNAQTLLLELVQVHRLVLLVAMCGAWWVAAGTQWRPIFGTLAAGAAAGFVLRLVTNSAIANGTYHSGTLFDLAWIIPFLCYASAAAATPPSRDEDVESLNAPVRHPSVLAPALSVLLIPVIGYGLLNVQPLPEPGESFRVLLTTLTTIGGLLLLTLRLAVEGTELQRADARVRLLAAATEQTAELILISRIDGAVEHANDAFVRAMQYSRSELSHMKLPDLTQIGPRDAAAGIDRAVREQGIWRGTIVRRRQDGTTFPAACTVVPLRTQENGAITHLVSVERDITEELHLRDQLVHSERLSAIGELIGGVAHEINNPLQTILGCAELMLDERIDPSRRRDAETIRREAARAGQIVRNLLSFVRRSAPNRTAVDLNEVIKTTTALREYHLATEQIRLTMELHPSPLLVVANRDEIQQIALNLLLNAEQAILGHAKSGTIVVRTSNAGRQQVLEVADSGPGVSAENRGKIFEPFFTTKPVGQGTGLGLSISHGIALAHGGSLELVSGTSSGACFRLSLPAQAAAEGPLHRETLRALVVGHEDRIRELVVQLLEHRAFNVTHVVSGTDALAAIARHPTDIVVAAMKLPDRGGWDLCEELSTLDEERRAPVILIPSERQPSTGAYPSLPGVIVLPRPFTATDFDAALDLALPGVIAAADHVDRQPQS